MGEIDGGIHAEKPGRWTPQRVNLRGLFTELSKVVVKVAGGAAMMSVAPLPMGVVAGWSTIASALPDLVAALANVGMLTEGERAYILVKRALSHALAELVVESHSLLSKAIGEGIFTQAGGEDVELVLAPDFVQHPREVTLLRPTQSLLEEWLTSHGLSEVQAKTTAERLPTYFGLSLHEELTQHAEFFGPLLRMLKSDTATLSMEAWAWDRYRAELIREPYRPLFDETFGLERIFVPLRAKWYEKKREGREEKQVEHEVALKATLTEWWAAGAWEDNLRVLSGDPGSGKSSCAKMWAAQMAEAHPGWRAVYVPLHEFGYRGDLRENLKTYLKDKKSIDVDLLEPRCPDSVLLFFDGLDELAMQGK